MKNTKKLMVFVVTVLTVVGLCMSSALACTMVYVGKGLTEGSSYMARSEDYSNMYNKIAYVSPHGLHKAGSVYEGCYGFKHVFTHDSYSYTACRDDNLSGVCPNCDGTHDHTPMEEAGSNEKGVSVSAMVTLSANNGVKNADKMVNKGMCESDMTTVLLGEATTAREGVALLEDIYKWYGAMERSGVLIGDKNEIWYVENYTGHEYIGVKLSDNMIAISPNMGAIGLVDLDDTENVVHSKNVIKVAQTAGTFVGDAEANTIDFRASYSNTSINGRMINGLNYFLGENKFTSGNTTSADFTISNVKDGEIVEMYTPIQTNRTLTTKELIDFYKVDQIGNTSNLEWHVFEINPSKNEDSTTIEWLAMENGQYTVAIPYFPVYTTEQYEGYMVGGLGRTSKNQTVVPFGKTGYIPGSKGYTILPEGWENGYYWSVTALSNYALSSKCTDEERAYVKAELAKMQQKCYEAAAEAEAVLPTLESFEAKCEYATKMSYELAKEAHELTLKLYEEIKKPEVTANVKDVDTTKWYFPAVRYAYAKGIMVGTGDETFEPDTNVTRAMLAQLLYNIEGKPAVENASSFTDVAADKWYSDAIAWAENNDLVAGFGDGTFHPDEDITREQMVTLLCNYASFKGADVSAEDELTFADTDEIADWAVSAVKWAVKNSIVAGIGNNTFAPDEFATRAQIAQLFYNYLSK